MTSKQWIRSPENGFTYSCLVDNEFIELHRHSNRWYDSNGYLVFNVWCCTRKYF